jgi:hypothetical protein
MMTANVSQELAGSSLRFTQVFAIRDASMRVDTDIDGDRDAWIYDARAGAIVHLDLLRKRTRSYDAALASVDAEREAPDARIDAELHQTGRSKTLLGAQCDEYAFSIRMSLGPSAADIVALKGAAWLASAGPGLADYLTFHRMAAERHIIFANRGASEQGDAHVTLALARGLTELHRRCAALGKMPYAVKLEYRRPRKGVLSLVDPRRRGWQSTTAVALTTTAIPDEAFVTPSDWTSAASGEPGPYRRVRDDPGDGRIRLFGQRLWLGLGVGVSALESRAARNVFGSAHWRPVIRLVGPLRSQGWRVSIAPVFERYDGTDLRARIIAATAGLSVNLLPPRRQVVPFCAFRAGPYLVRTTPAGTRLHPGVNAELGLSFRRNFVLSGSYQFVGRTNGFDLSSWSVNAIVRVF